MVVVALGRISRWLPWGAPQDCRRRREPASATAPSPEFRTGEEQWWRVDPDLDLVVVATGAGGDNGSDWSVGWLEPHAPEFLIGADGESCFSVLVRCYGGESSGDGRRPLAAGEPDGGGVEGKDTFERWLSSLQSG
ncbi:unnamed protein product [Spirodela intermedia]|uniref:Uncharacterized protein n=1 Tax=Spirodela intermedia TaxID=51605 RepID=A0A7I8IZ61_SPIIN|nr:unnamed protein product [Spirodela intermedia]CAA6663089.1 unnamed protein product [Spirodela intermedia]